MLTELPPRIEVKEWVATSDSASMLMVDALKMNNVMAARQLCIFGNGKESAKMKRLGELVDDCMAKGEKVLVFSYFLGALSCAEEVVGGHFRIDGSLTAAKRSLVIEKLLATEGPAVLLAQIEVGGVGLLAQIEVGGVGLNLQAASAVITLEPQWKPTTEWQAIKRAHRIGQGRAVNVHRLLAAGTIEERIDELLTGKGIRFELYAKEFLVAESSANATANESVEAEVLKREAAAQAGQPERSLTGDELASIHPDLLRLIS